VPPPGPNWDACSLRVSEANVRELPAILARAESHAAEMGRLARQEWTRWYAAENVFHTAVEHLLLARRLCKREGLRDWLATYALYLEPFYLRHWVLSPLKQRLQSKLDWRM